MAVDYAEVLERWTPEQRQQRDAAVQLHAETLMRNPGEAARIAQEFAAELRRYSEELHELVRARLRLESTGDRVAALELNRTIAQPHTARMQDYAAAFFSPSTRRRPLEALGVRVFIVRMGRSATPIDLDGAAWAAAQLDGLRVDVDNVARCAAAWTDYARARAADPTRTLTLPACPGPAPREPRTSSLATFMAAGLGFAGFIALLKVLHR